ncbi:MAG TPA: nuclear transport factor 2 family protein [Sphingomicrobium sp.]|nr:nuclear transport factor 2 family protein [Sphingomicrobium sp.]
MFGFVMAASLAVQAAPADPATAEITRLEQQWGEAFVKRDFEFIDRIVAPEYRLVGAAPDDRHAITLRAEWMKNARLFVHHAFTVETVDVNRVGETAVASARGLWTVSFREGAPPTPIRFFVTDTWLRRGGKWQVIHRYSHRLGNAPPMAAKAD